MALWVLSSLLLPLLRRASGLTRCLSGVLVVAIVTLAATGFVAAPLLPPESG